MLTVAEEPGPLIASVTAFPLASVPVNVKVLPVSEEPAEVIVAFRAGTNVATPPSVRAPSMVKLAAPPVVCAVQTPFGSAAAISDDKTWVEKTSDPAISYSLISPRKIMALYAALPGCGNPAFAFGAAAFLAGAFLAAAFLAGAFLVATVVSSQASLISGVEGSSPLNFPLSFRARLRVVVAMLYAQVVSNTPILCS